MSYRLIVWDFDGTLADTLALSVEVYNAMAARYGFLPLTDFEAVRGLTGRSFFRRHGIPYWRLPALAAEYRVAVKDHMPSIRLFDGVSDVLRGLRDSGRRLGVLSSNAAGNIRVCLEANGVSELFDFVVGYPRLLGKAVAIRKLLRRERTAPGALLYIGDEVRDVKAARAAGVDVAAVGWGFHTGQLLSRYGPTYVLERPDDLLAALTGREEEPPG